MSYKEKPIIKLYKYENSAFSMVAQIDDYKEVSFENNLYSAGNFTITINYNIPNALLFERGFFVQIGESSYNFGEIYVIKDKIGEDGKGSQIRTITGYDARYILKRRVIKNLNSNGMWKMTAKGEVCLRNLIADQCGVNAESKRRLPITNTIPSTSEAVGKEYSVSEQFTNLYEVCKTIATQSEMGWRLKFENRELSLECFEGTDRSSTVQFSPDFDSLSNGEFSDSSESFSNAVYIGGKGQNDERDIYEGENGTPNGLDRFEAWDDQSQMTTTDEYTAKALSMLTQYGQTVNVSGNGLAKCPYIFGEEYEVGDIITIAFSGKKAVAQILSVTERWAWNQYDINFSFGKTQNNLAEQLQLMLRKIQGASNKANTTESVKWYTIPTVSAMPADDVTFNTIGFTGTMTANSTFTLYRDSEGTGAKSYNVYCKNLSGNYTLTLTTGVSGASNFTIKGGSNIVARILVDENGNIVSQSMTATDTIESGNNQPATSEAVAEALVGKLDNTLQTIQGSEVDGLSGSKLEIYKVSYYNIGWANGDGLIIHIPWSINFAYQIAMDNQSNWLAVRSKDNGTWRPWKVLSDSSNDDSDFVDITNQVNCFLGVNFVRVIKRNNLVYMAIGGTYTGNPTIRTQTLITNLPSKYRTSKDQFFAVVGYSGNSPYVYPSRLSINNDTVYLQETSMPNGGNLTIGFMYISI